MIDFDLKYRILPKPHDGLLSVYHLIRIVSQSSYCCCFITVFWASVKDSRVQIVYEGENARAHARVLCVGADILDDLLRL